MFEVLVFVKQHKAVQHLVWIESIFHYIVQQLGPQFISA